MEEYASWFINTLGILNYVLFLSVHDPKYHFLFNSASSNNNT